MKWRDISPGWAPQPHDRLAPDLAARLEARFATGADAPVRVCVEAGALSAAREHLSSARVEQGGLLVGETVSMRDGRLLVWVQEVVAAVEFESSSVSLRMDTQVWTLARERLGGERLIVGWYHSHPDLGAFFSHTDRRTQAAFFAHEYSLGWVIDPIRAEQAWFCGPQSVPLGGAVVEFLPGR